MRFLMIGALVMGFLLAACGGSDGADEARDAAQIQAQSETQGGTQAEAPGEAQADGGADNESADAAAQPDAEAVAAASPEAQAARAALSTAAARVADAGSVRMDVTITLSGVEGLSGEATASGELVVDARNARARALLDLGPLLAAASGQSGDDADAMVQALLQQLGEEPIELVLAGNLLYLRWPPIASLLGVTTPWLSIELEGQVGGHLADLADPEQLVAGLLDDANMVEVGREDVDGESLRRFEGTLTADAVADLGAAAAALDADAAEGRLVLWLDDDDLPRRLQVTVSEADAGTAEIVVIFSGFGSEVVIETPPADQVSDASAAIEGLFGLFGGAPGGGAEGAGEAYGDDPRLDALWDGCEGGDFAACDELYLQAPIGSEYETFGDTCGGRFEAGSGLLCTQREE